METNEELLNEAKKASKKAYSPYSNFSVGACCLFKNGNKYTGSNVENISYGLTLCAERNALGAAISNGEKKGLVAIAVYSPNQKPCEPCGACLQWMAEFRADDEDVKIILESESGKAVEHYLSGFLPHCFKIN